MVCHSYFAMAEVSPTAIYEHCGKAKFCCCFHNTCTTQTSEVTDAIWMPVRLSGICGDTESEESAYWLVSYVLNIWSIFMYSVLQAAEKSQWACHQSWARLQRWWCDTYPSLLYPAAHGDLTGTHIAWWHFILSSPIVSRLERVRTLFVTGIMMMHLKT